jgi:hypothetical protein
LGNGGCPTLRTTWREHHYFQQGSRWVACRSSNLTYHCTCQNSSAPNGTVRAFPIRWGSCTAPNLVGQSPSLQSDGAVTEPPISLLWQRQSLQCQNLEKVIQISSSSSGKGGCPSMRDHMVGELLLPEMLQQGSLSVAGGGSNLTYHSPCQSSSALSGTVTDLPGCISQCFARCRMWS